MRIVEVISCRVILQRLPGTSIVASGSNKIVHWWRAQTRAKGYVVRYPSPISISVPLAIFIPSPAGRGSAIEA